MSYLPPAHEAVRAEQEAAVEAALSRIGLEAKVAVVAGQDTWTLRALPEIGQASIVMSGGPVGVRGVTWSAADPSIALPSPTAAPGESATVTVAPERAFQILANGWTTVPGEYLIEAAHSLDDVRSAATITVA